jgi:hypothetical protein
MIQSVTTRPSEHVLFDDLSARTDPGFWDSVLSPRPLTRSLETSTALPLAEPNVRDEIVELFKSAIDEVFDNDTESDFVRGLRSIILRHGEGAIDALAGIVFFPRINEGLAAESFEVLGRMDDPITRNRRLWTLESGLFSNSARIRDAAGLGLASLDDPHAIPYVRKAINEERFDELREDLEQVLKQLQETAQCQ